VTNEKFLEPLMRFARGDVRDHIVSSKIDHGPPLWRRKAAQRQRSPKINFREIFGVVRFSTFATISVMSRHFGDAATTVAIRIGRWPPICRWERVRVFFFFSFFGPSQFSGG